MRAVAVAALLLGGCYHLDELVAPSGGGITLVDAPRAKAAPRAGDAVIDLPGALSGGDLLVLSVSIAAGDPPNAAPPGWVLDAAYVNACGGVIAYAHRVTDGSDAGQTLDLTPLTNAQAYAAIITAYRGVAGLGASGDGYFFMPTGPVSLDVPSATAGQVAYLTAFVSGLPGKSWTPPDRGRLIDTAGNIATFDVTLADPVPAMLSVAAAPPNCTQLRLQLLTPK